jgi:hypothetical protein
MWEETNPEKVGHLKVAAAGCTEKEKYEGGY